MDFRISLRFLVFVSLTVSAAGCGGDDTVDPSKLTDFQREVLDIHNTARAHAQPTPVPALEPLRWSLHAEEVAKDYADKCIFEHNKDRGHLGENLAAAPVGVWTTREAMQGWVDEEVSYYDYADNTCAPDQMCGHYTQVVWRATTGVGCAVKTCTKNSPFEHSPTWQLWVCDYTPAGNVEGEKPY